MCVFAQERVYVHVCACVSESKRRCVRFSVHLFCQGGGIFFWITNMSIHDVCDTLK